MKTSFFMIDRVTLSFDSSVFVVNGLVRDNQKNIQKYEVFDLAKKKGIKECRISK